LLTPQAAFEGLQAQLAANRSEFYRAVPSGPFYNFDQPGVEPSEVTIANWWCQGMMGGAKGQYECIFAFIREDYTDDLKSISVPVLVMHGEADRIVPCPTGDRRRLAGHVSGSDNVQRWHRRRRSRRSWLSRVTSSSPGSAGTGART
jgi:pimeloyl-ACP methyl ester carboxylesterase